MISKMDVGIKGIQDLMTANQIRIALISPGGELDAEIKAMTIGLHRYTVAITHVWRYKGGGLRASHRMELNGATGEIFIDPSTINPRGQKPVEYGPKEHARGGSHAFYQRAVDERGPKLAKAAMKRIGRSLTARVTK